MLGSSAFRAKTLRIRCGSIELDRTMAQKKAIPSENHFRKLKCLRDSCMSDAPGLRVDCWDHVTKPRILKLMIDLEI